MSGKVMGEKGQWNLYILKKRKPPPKGQQTTS